ncbi:putative phage protein (TIGR02218 family) [Yoonia maricola]|uniref:Putative phage protein (TIGR02218 family) n=1 Tax=Yoonia maricola TaxID=420999 RepID=A0A2M8WMP1_9RHOB|nr:DUF2163 domain-containing protein [Yoonia maricola]PJI92146.1 putative phage protein (TIGR02218 family) [Yoonia maricola]
MSEDILYDHLRRGVTHTCHCWLIRRLDGTALGFTDHDASLQFDGIVFAPQSGLSARAIASTTGLSINNTEAFGVLSDDAITEADILAGRYDGATVQVWLVCWDDVAARKTLFRGSLGEITRGAGGFEAELHGLTEVLNQTQGRTYMKTCGAVLGDARCRFAVDQASYRLDYTLTTATDGQVFTLEGVENFNAGWFESGLLEVLTGAAAGLKDVIKSDVGEGDRVLTLWSPLNAVIVPGDVLRVTAGCDKTAATCREKFDNFLNYQGFPDMPGEDWMVSVPRSDETNAGGSLNR